MKRYIAALILILCAAGYSSAQGPLGVTNPASFNGVTNPDNIIGVSGLAAGGITCSGDFSSGQYESFEKGTGQFCTSDWTESDDSAAIDTYSSSYSNCGSYALAVTYNAAGGDDYAVADFGSTDDDFYFRVYIKTADIPDNKYSSINFAPGPTSYHAVFQAKYIDSSTGGTDARIYLANGGTNSTNYFEIVEGDEIRLEIHALCNGGSPVAKVWKWGGSSWDVVYNDAGDPNDTITVTAAAYSCQDIVFGTETNTVDDSTILYFDDAQVGLSAGDYLGDRVCD